jgi:hypothetical protein
MAEKAIQLFTRRVFEAWIIAGFVENPAASK